MAGGNLINIEDDVSDLEAGPVRRDSVGEPAPDSVVEQLERILSSPEFNANDHRKAFLRYVIEETLAGRAERVKGYSVGVSVFGRDENFDPHTDPVVRLEARRLRRELEHYYLTAGRDDPIRISIPKGAYVPIFEPVAAAKKTGEKSKWYQSRKVAFALAIVLMVGVSTVIVWFLADQYAFENQAGLKRSQNLPEIAEIVIAVLPFSIIGDSSIGRQLTAGLSADVVTELSHLDKLQVIAYGSSSRLSDHDNPQEDARSLLGATHLVRGSIQFEGDFFRIDVHLEDLVKNRQIWAESFDFRLENILSAQAEIARQVSAALAVTFSDHRQREIEQITAINFETRVLISQASIMVRPASDPARVQAGTLLFKRAIELEPLAPSGYAGLAYLQALAAWFGSAQDVDSALETAVTNAKKAISLDRKSARAFLALAVVAMLNDDYEKAIEHLDTAILTRPSYALANAWRGLMLTFSGQARKGILPLLTAIRLDPINPRTPYLNMLGVTYFHSGDIKMAVETLTKNFRNNGPRGPHIVAYVVASHFHLGEIDKARQAFQDFQKIENGFPLERWLQLSFQDPKDVELVLGALRQLRAEN